MAQITVNGRPYELVPIDDLTLDEAMILNEYSKLTLDQIPDIEGFHPGVTKALIHIAVGVRVSRTETARTIRDTVGKLKIRDLLSVFEDISEEQGPGRPSSELARAQRATRRFWRGFDAHWGAAPGGQPPERFWQPWLGHWCHLRPQDLGGMTPDQLEACHDWVKPQPP